jgi:hypothetical protein
MDLIFAEDDHIYRHGEGGEILPSATEILKAEGYTDPTWWTSEGCIRGTYVHKMVYLHNVGDLDVDNLDPQLQGRYAAYLLFLKETGFQILDSETMVHSHTYRYAGRYDIRGRFPNRLFPAVVDTKSGGVEPSVALQLGLYTSCLDGPHERVSLQLKDNGKYVLKWWSDRSDIGVALGAVAGFHWKNNNLKRR